ncbi:unnamed protein product, partial [Mesorhabditis belari]
MRQQSVAVHGKLMCGSKPASGVTVKLWDEDDGPDRDDELDKKQTDGNGEFRLQGTTRELTSIDPVFKIYHDCDDGIKPGQRKVKFRIPSSYISSAFRFQSVAVTGKIFCGDKPAARIRVKLREAALVELFDEVLDQGFTDLHGHFHLEGYKAELSQIEPYFHAHYECNDGELRNSKCCGKLRVAIPKDTLGDGKKSPKVFDFGVLNLETIFAEEKRKKEALNEEDD